MNATSSQWWSNLISDHISRHVVITDEGALSEKYLDSLRTSLSGWVTDIREDEWNALASLLEEMAQRETNHSTSQCLRNLSKEIPLQLRRRYDKH